MGTLGEQFSAEEFASELKKRTKKDKQFQKRYANKTLKGKDFPWKAELDLFAQNNDIWADVDSEEEREEELAAVSDSDSFVWSSSESESSDEEDEKDMFKREFWVKTDK